MSTCKAKKQLTLFCVHLEITWTSWEHTISWVQEKSNYHYYCFCFHRVTVYSIIVTVMGIKVVQWVASQGSWVRGLMALWFTGFVECCIFSFSLWVFSSNTVPLQHVCHDLWWTGIPFMVYFYLVEYFKDSGCNASVMWLLNMNECFTNLIKLILGKEAYKISITSHISVIERKIFFITLSNVNQMWMGSLLSLVSFKVSALYG